MVARRIVFAIGATALCGAMAADFAGVAGRAIGWNPLGLVEVVQLFVVAAITCSLVIATLEGAHAAVHMLTARLSPRMAQVLERLSNLCGALLFGGLATGAVWMLGDTWPLDERTDVLGLPVAPERIIAIFALAWISLIFLAAVFRRPAEAGIHADRA